jgi:cobyrinic acid a,c-diamide synthase
MFEDRGHYPNCRHYKKTGDRTFLCKKNDTQKKNCSGCMVCPNCGGMMYTYRMKKDLNRNHIYITHAKSCNLCGAYVEEQYVMASQIKKEVSKENQCQVEGCRCGAHEGFRTDDIHRADQTFTICLSHKRRIKTWRLHLRKGIEQVPLIVREGRLYDNPDYEMKQGKRKP